MAIHTLSIDVETFSDVDLKKCGVYKYAESPDFEILLFGVSVDGGEVTVYDLASGDTVPEEIIKAISDDSVIKWAYNASFERICLSVWLRRNYPQYFSSYSIEVKLENGRKASPVSSYESDSFRFLEKVVAKVYPEAVPVPFILGGGTDSRNYSEVSDDIYRFLPMIVEPDQQRRVHGIDENITVERLGELVSFFRTLISDLE